MKNILYLICIVIIISSCNSQKRYASSIPKVKANIKSDVTQKFDFKQSNRRTQGEMLVIPAHSYQPIAINDNPIVLNKVSRINAPSKKIIAPIHISAKKLEKITAIVNKKMADNNNNGAKTALIVLGIVLAIIGIFILWYVSILGGALLIIAGIIMTIVGGSMPNNPSQTTPSHQQEQPQKEAPVVYQDVVYLKNGSIIRGTIIEQVPNVSLKIQTKDGSVFVEKMDEVEKMTKEQVKQ